MKFLDKKRAIILKERLKYRHIEEAIKWALG